MAKHELSTQRITGKFRYLYASAAGINQKPKKLWFTINISEKEEAVTYDVEIDSKLFSFTDQQSAIDYYNQF